MLVRTFTPKAGEITRSWYLIDAQDVVLGRLAAHAANLLRGKHKSTFAPHMDMGDFVVVINADKVVLTGLKNTQKVSHQHSGYPGGVTSTVYSDLFEKLPTRAVEKAIRGMLPKNSVGRSAFTKLKVYAGSEHPHAAQNPKVFEFNQVSQIVKE
jgi:large subunit ribosomal protein L13